MGKEKNICGTITNYPSPKDHAADNEDSPYSNAEELGHDVHSTYSTVDEARNHFPAPQQVLNP